MLKHGLLLLSALLATTGVVELARSDNDSLVLRRQTLIVRDIDTSLALYRDAIGMTVIYDQVIRRPHKPHGPRPPPGPPGGAGSPRGRACTTRR